MIRNLIYLRDLFVDSVATPALGLAVVPSKLPHVGAGYQTLQS